MWIIRKAFIKNPLNFVPRKKKFTKGSYHNPLIPSKKIWGYDFPHTRIFFFLVTRERAQNQKSTYQCVVHFLGHFGDQNLVLCHSHMLTPLNKPALSHALLGCVCPADTLKESAGERGHILWVSDCPYVVWPVPLS